MTGIDRDLYVIEVASTPFDAQAVLAPLRSALDGGSAVAPVASGQERKRLLDVLAPETPLELPGIAAILPTSGSTGEPKAALLPASALLHSAYATHERLGGPGSWLLALPPTRVAGLQVLVRGIVAGTEPTVLEEKLTADSFVAASKRLSDSTRRYVSLVPTQLARLLADAAATDALRSYDAILLGGGSTPPSLRSRAEEAGVAVVRSYGMTETSGGCVYDGRPLRDVEVRLDADGRVLIGGPVLFAGYRLRPDLTAEALVDGWHRTGDLGELDADGVLRILGRVDDVVISGGVNIPLTAVEHALATLPGVAEAAAVGVPDDEWGTRVVAHLVLHKDVPAPTLAAVRDHVAESLPRTHAPRELVVIDKLPLLPSGKVDRPALRIL
ncbi:o-succinylbenzoate--CoA ligase [Tenggerimyces flavus]|uniref:O-succinylbenzoate--CoA ligase n=1 Tax=Tenggerimyces flavus TaxID=1708749 RepID=A0ABV7Y5H5_9ACTN|nr:o-succinylbenzoate--CoA ligase [Tenggerimyces flavus]MBM7791223.1 O-succinylbenzoic acid--CoA ligase [Tenggerimyces flavus]